MLSTTTILIPIVALSIGMAALASAQETSKEFAENPANTDTIHRIAFGSCAKHWQYQPIWETVIATQPDLFLFLGDAIYADNDGATAWEVTEKQLQGEWNRLADKPEYQRFRSKIPILATWDNHDYGTHNGGADFELKESSKKMFLDFFEEPARSERRQRAGIYDAKVFGPAGKRVQIILLDTRTFRGPFKQDQRAKEERLKTGKVGGYLPQDDRETTVLGDDQWAWLEEQLRVPAEIRLVCSSTQIIPDKKGLDEWGCFPHERQRLIDVIETTKANEVILLSGNVHFAEVSEVESRGKRLLEFTSSGLTHVNEKYSNAKNEFRIAGPYADLNFGLIEIDWAKPSELITLKAIAADGSTAFAHRVILDNIE
jgi:alkaline phosphatase D